MLAKEADSLKSGNKVITLNGPYTQQAYVISVGKDSKGIRRIEYKWKPPGTKDWKFGCKRHMSVYLPKEVGG